MQEITICKQLHFQNRKIPSQINNYFKLTVKEHLSWTTMATFWGDFFLIFPCFFTTSTSKNFTVWCLSLLYMYYETYSISQIKFYRKHGNCSYWKSGILCTTLLVNKKICDLFIKETTLVWQHPINQHQILAF